VEGKEAEGLRGSGAGGVAWAEKVQGDGEGGREVTDVTAKPRVHEPTLLGSGRRRSGKGGDGCWKDTLVVHILKVEGKGKNLVGGKLGITTTTE